MVVSKTNEDLLETIIKIAYNIWKHSEPNTISTALGNNDWSTKLHFTPHLNTVNHWLNRWIFSIRIWCNWWMVHCIIMRHHTAIKSLLYIWWCIMMQWTIHWLHHILIHNIHLFNQWLYYHGLYQFQKSLFSLDHDNMAFETRLNINNNHYYWY